MNSENKKIADAVKDSRNEKEAYESPEVINTANLKEITRGGDHVSVPDGLIR